MTADIAFVDRTRRLPRSPAFAAFDTAMAGLCTNHSLVCVLAQFATADDFRTNFAAFRAMGAVKVGSDPALDPCFVSPLLLPPFG